MITLLTWLISASLHAAFAAYFLYQPGADALQQGPGEDLLVVEQGVAIEGITALGEHEVSTEAVQAPPPQMSQYSPPVPETEILETAELAEPFEPQPVEVEPVEKQETELPKPEPTPLEDSEVIESVEGPEQQLDIAPEVEPIEEPPEELEVEPEVEQVQKQPPPQIATLVHEPSVQKMQSSGQERTGGETTSRSAYLGSLRQQLETKKINPRSRYSGTVLVRFTINRDGELMFHEIEKSSGFKVLDQAALTSVERSAPFPAIPEDWSNQKFTLVVPYQFSVRQRR